MSAAKFAAITTAIADRIHAGLYVDTLPSTRALAAEFGVARQTMLNALRPLATQKLIVMRRGNAGIGITPSAHHGGGLIGLVSGHKLEELIRFGTFRQLSELLEIDGYSPLVLGLPKIRMPFLAERLFKADFAGVIFTNSSLTLDMAVFLESHGIPFVSANRLPNYPKLSFVENAAFDAILEIASRLQCRGFRHIALCFTSVLEGYANLIRAEWKKIKLKLGLPYHDYDDFLPDAHRSTDEQTQQILAHLIHAHPVEAVINWSHLDSCSIRLLEQSPLHHITVVTARPPEAETSCRLVRLREFDYNELTRPLWQALRELLLARPEKPIHRFIKHDIEFLDPLPSPFTAERTVRS